jgi:hypothetical protein
MNYGEIFSRAFAIVWRSKILWVFGILASCAGNLGLNLSAPTGGPPNQPGTELPVPNGVGGSAQSLLLEVIAMASDRWAPGFAEQNGLLLFCLSLLLGLGFAILLAVLTSAGRVALIQGTLEANENGSSLPFREAIEQLRPFLGRAIGLNLSANLVVGGVLVLFLVCIGFFITATFGFGAFCAIPILCLVPAVVWFYTIYVEQANIALVVDDLPVRDAFSTSWRLVRANLPVVLLLGLMLGVAGAIGYYILNLPLLFSVWGVLLVELQGGLINDFAGGGYLVAGLCLVLYLPVLLLLTGAVAAFIRAAWTLAYLELELDLAAA